MKKVFLILLLSLSMACLFAGDFNVTLGGGYGYKSIRMDKDSEYFTQIKGFGGQAGINYVFDNNVYLFGDFSMMFPQEQTFKSEDGKDSLTKDDIKGTTSFTDVDYSAYAFTVGAGYRFKVDDNFSLLLGAGFRYDNDVLKCKGTSGDDDEESMFGDVKDPVVCIATLGVGLDLEAYYFFSENFGLMLAAKPNLGLCTVSTVSDGNNFSGNADGINVSFTVNGAAGVVVRF